MPSITSLTSLELTTLVAAKSQGYGAIKTWEKKIFYDLLWRNEISDLNNFNTEEEKRPSVAAGLSQTLFYSQHTYCW